MQDPDLQLLRTVLYVPASKPKVLAKAPTLGADALILDLEDSVPPQAKAEARIMARDTLMLVTKKQVLRTVRINAMSTDLWIDDATTIFSGQPESIVLPKVGHVDELQPLDALLTELEQRQPGEYLCKVWAMIESPLGVINSYAIASHPRVSCLVMGTSDLSAALGVGVAVERKNFHVALQQTILAAKAANIPIIDGVFVDLDDQDGFATQCREGADLGFDGKTVIHPKQIAPANRLFLPSAFEVSKARKILSAWLEAKGNGEEICLVDGALVERLHAHRAGEILRSVGETVDFTEF